MANDAMRELYVAELRDLYNAETQLTKALPKMAKAASNSELRQAFEEHLRSLHTQKSVGFRPGLRGCIGRQL